SSLSGRTTSTSCCARVPRLPRFPSRTLRRVAHWLSRMTPRAPREVTLLAAAEAMEATNLAIFWASVIAVSIIIYVILDGFDLGVGVLFSFTRDESSRVQMLNTIAPFWDGNETWLVI